MAKAPIIGLNADLEQQTLRLRRAYLDAIVRAGGLPLVLPPVRGSAAVARQLAAVDGLLLTGGADYRPALYGGRSHPAVELCLPAREEYDCALAAAALERGVPTLGICGGLQLINICRGGTLHVHVKGHAKTTHGVTVFGAGRLAAILGSTTLRVNSSHHQAVRRPGRGLRVAAYAKDGLIEALEGTGAAFLLGVQWHPERMRTRSAERLFRAFVRAVRT
jgi:putative glutamine amidotransferase